MEKRNKPTGLKISTFNTGMIIVSCLLYLCLLTATFYASRNYEDLVHTVDDYIRLEDAAKDILRASDYLTEQVRLYAMTLDPEYAGNYFEEVNVVRRRENALMLMRQHSLDLQREESLELAVDRSDELMIREIYVMRLVAAAEGHGADVMPPEVTSLVLDAADLKLTPQEKIDKARAMLFDQEYQRQKAEIYDSLDYFTQGVLGTTEQRLVLGLDHLSSSISTQRVLLSVLVILNLVTFLVITLLVVKPLRVFLRCVRERSLFRVTGAYEFKYLAQVYNEIYRISDSLAASEAFLRTKAERDGLTGILNRYMFQQVCDLLKESGAPLALLLADVDKFKEVNDTYGHAAGDRVLIRVAELLKGCIRETDYVFRIGGDEFAAILTPVNRERAEMIRMKILQVNETLCKAEEDCAAVSLSVGIALSDHGYRDSLYEQADRALYAVKENGRNGCMFYTEDLAERE